MGATAFGHRLETLHDGVTLLTDGSPAPMPLTDTRIAVEITRGLALIRCTRVFRNAEDRPIEAILTMPVGFDTVVTGLVARVDGRVLQAAAQLRSAARETYERGLDKGRLSLLHEEVLRGVHMLSVGQLPPGAEVEVEMESVAVLVRTGAAPLLRLPTTVGQLYGTSPLAPVDDLVTSAKVRHDAELTVSVDTGGARLNGRDLPEGASVRVLLDAALEIEAPGTVFGPHEGGGAEGRQVLLDLAPLPDRETPLDLAVLVDRSGSTSSRADGPGGPSVWQAMRDGLRDAFGGLIAADRLALWQFDDRCRELGRATGAAAAEMLTLLDGPGGGTQLGRAVEKVLRSGARDVLVLTDGQTWEDEVAGLMASRARISAVLVGPGSLDANIGRLCAMTGGQVFYARGADPGSSAAAALSALRHPAGPACGDVSAGIPSSVCADRGGVQVSATWLAAETPGEVTPVARFAAALAMPLLSGGEAETWAMAHGLCTHLTSLVLVDEDGAQSEGLAQTRKVPLMRSDVAPASMDFLASFEDAMPLQEMRQPVPARRPGIVDDTGMRALGRHAERPRQAPQASRPFDGFDWLALGDALLAGDLSRLTPDQRAVVAARAKSPRARRLSRDLHLPSDLVALGLIALVTAPERVARRFAAKVFGDALPEVWAKQ